MAISNPFKGMSKTQVYATLAGSAALAGYLEYKHHASTGSWNPWSSGSSSAAPTSTSAIDPVTGLPSSQDNATDPLTNLTYLAEAEQYGSVAAAEADVTQFGQSSATGSGIGVSPATYPVAGSPSGTQAGSPYASNAAWAQAAQAGLTDVGYDSTSVARALGEYLTAQPLSTSGSPSDWSIVNTAIAEYGQPPVTVPAPVQQPSSGPAATATVPDVKGMPVSEADAVIRAAGLVPGTGSTGTGTVTGQTPAGGTKVAPNSKVDLEVSAAAAAAPKTAPAGFSVTPHPGYADLGWGTVTGASSYQYELTGPSHVEEQIPGTHAEHVALQPGRYKARVRAGNGTGYGPWTAYKTLTVPGTITGGNPPHA